MDTQNTTEGVEEKKNRLGLAPSARKEKFVILLCNSPCICRLSQACICVKVPQSHLGMLTHFALVNPAPVGQQVLAAAFRTSVDWSPLISWLTCSVDWSLLLSSADCVVLLTDLSCWLISTAPFCWLSPSGLSWTFLPSSTSGLVGDLAHRPFVWVLCQNRQRNHLTGTLTHQHNECPTSCLKVVSPNFSNLSPCN